MNLNELIGFLQSNKIYSPCFSNGERARFLFKEGERRLQTRHAELALDSYIDADEHSNNLRALEVFGNIIYSRSSWNYDFVIKMAEKYDLDLVEDSGGFRFHYAINLFQKPIEELRKGILLINLAQRKVEREVIDYSQEVVATPAREIVEKILAREPKKSVRVSTTGKGSESYQTEKWEKVEVGGRRRYTLKARKRARKLYMEGLKLREIAERMGVPIQSVWALANPRKR